MLAIRRHSQNRLGCGRGFTLAMRVLLLAGLCISCSAQDSTPDSSHEVRVTVTDRDTEAAIARARVEVVRFPDLVIRNGFTSSEGLFVFVGLDPGSYHVRAYQTGYVDVDIPFEVYSQQDMLNLSVRMESTKNREASGPGARASAAQLKRPKSAVKEFEKGMELLEKKKDAEGSLPHFESAIAAVPDYHEAYFLMGVAQVQLGSAEDGRKSLAKAVDLAPDFLPAYYPLALVLYGEGKFEEENALLMKGIALDSKDWRWPFELARSLARLEKWPEALQYGLKAHDNHDAPTKVHLLLGDLYKHNNQPGEAIAEYEDFLRKDPKSPLVPRAQEALKDLREAVAQPK
jgi:tetratricopeptide (TPR) repeat protein